MTDRSPTPGGGRECASSDPTHERDHRTISDLDHEVWALRDLCRRAADSAEGYWLTGGVYAELRNAGDGQLFDLDVIAALRSSGDTTAREET